MYDWFPLVFFPLKIAVLGVGMFFSIKWHYDQESKSDGTGRAGRRSDRPLMPRLWSG